MAPIGSASTRLTGCVSSKGRLGLQSGKLADTAALENDLIKAASQHQDRKSLAVGLVIQGKPQAFVDFFLLTHEPAASTSGASDEGLRQEQLELPPESLLFLQEQTMQAHDAVRAGDTHAAFDAYRQLGRYFSQLDQLDKAASFYEKCLQVTKQGSWLEGELEASRALGVVYEALAQPNSAAAAHERCLAIATTSNRPDDAQAAYASLVTVYAQQAEQCERAGDLDTAMQLLVQCLQAADKCSDAAAAGHINHRIGLIHQRRGAWQQALACQATFLAAARDSGDRKAEGQACCAYAECQRQLGDLEGAVSSLETYLEIARGQAARGQAVACCKLGAIRFGQGQHEQAVSYYERAFELARGISDRKLLDMARANLGISRGALCEAAYKQAAQSDLGALLQFKATGSSDALQSSSGLQGQPAP